MIRVSQTSLPDGSYWVYVWDSDERILGFPLRVEPSKIYDVAIKRFKEWYKL